MVAFKRWWAQRPGREKLMLSACSLGVVLALSVGRASLGFDGVVRALKPLGLAPAALGTPYLKER